jgi:hypothetical protein
MLGEMENDQPTSHAIADGWQEFTERVLQSIRGAKDAEAQVAFHFGAMQVLQLTQRVIADRSGAAVSLASEMLEAELDESMKACAISTQ